MHGDEMGLFYRQKKIHIDQTQPYAPSQYDICACPSLQYDIYHKLCDTIYANKMFKSYDLIILLHVYLPYFSEQFDTVFEAASMAVNIGLWYTKHAAKLAAKEK